MLNMADGQAVTSQPSQRRDDDPFANFSFVPPKPVGRFRAFTRRSKYRAMADFRGTRDKLGSQTSLATLSGSRSKLDAGSLMSMQEDARSRRISSEVMKHRLYESVVTSPRRRRMSLNYGAMDDSAQGFSKAFMIQSLPVTPAHSQYGSPETSPTEQRRFLFGYFSRGTTPLVRTPSEEDMCIDSNDIPEEDSWKGLASMFNPQPRCIPAVNSGRHSYVCSIDEEMASNGAAKGSGMGGGMAGDSLVLEAPPRASKKRTRSTASIEVDSERRHSPVDSDRRHSPVN